MPMMLSGENSSASVEVDSVMMRNAMPAETEKHDFIRFISGGEEIYFGYSVGQAFPFIVRIRILRMKG